MNEEFVLHFNFILILILVSSHFSNFLLMSNSSNSSLKCLRFVSKRFIKSTNSLSSLHLILINLHNYLLKLHFSLNPVLFGFSLVFRLFNNQIVLLLKWILQLLRLKLRRNQVFLKTIEHMLVLLLSKFFISMFSFQIVKCFFCFRFQTFFWLFIFFQVHFFFSCFKLFVL